jgi:hypothetical protein
VELTIEIFHFVVNLHLTDATHPLVASLPLVFFRRECFKR